VLVVAPGADAAPSPRVTSSCEIRRTVGDDDMRRAPCADLLLRIDYGSGRDRVTADGSTWSRGTASW
jgi:hypothetical protein